MTDVDVSDVADVAEIADVNIAVVGTDVAVASVIAVVDF